MGYALYGNESAFVDTFSTTGLSNGDNLRTANLSPGATFTAAQAVITMDWPSTKGTIDAIVVAGVSKSTTVNGVAIPDNVDDLRPVFYLEIDTGSGYAEVPCENVARIRSTPFSAQHYAIILPERYTTADKIRLTINLSTGAKIGCVRAMRMLDDRSLFAKQGAFTPTDSAVTEYSSGGQAYSGPGQVARQILVQHGQMPDWVLHGGLPNPVEVDLPAPSNGGGVTISGGEIYNTTAGVTGGVDYTGKSWELNKAYEIRARAWVEGAAGAATLSPTIGFSLPLADAFRRFYNDVSTTSISLTLGVSASQRVHLIDSPQIFVEGSDQAKARRFLESGWGDVIGATESGQPILVVESDLPHEQGFTGYWGIISRWGDYRRTGGNLSTGSFTLRELL